MILVLVLPVLQPPCSHLLVPSKVHKKPRLLQEYTAHCRWPHWVCSLLLCTAGTELWSCMTLSPKHSMSCPEPSSALAVPCSCSCNTFFSFLCLENTDLIFNILLKYHPSPMKSSLTSPIKSVLLSSRCRELEYIPPVRMYRTVSQFLSLAQKVSGDGDCVLLTQALSGPCTTPGITGTQISSPSVN